MATKNSKSVQAELKASGLRLPHGYEVVKRKPRKKTAKKKTVAKAGVTAKGTLKKGYRYAKGGRVVKAKKS